MMSDRFMIISDLYNRIFTVQTSHSEVEVDYVTWNRIFALLPHDYQLPDNIVLSLRFGDQHQ
ncbi:hypothetical protein RE628_23385 [Paenibacillus sp. D2_2]|uniref:hypothetical protein n=1 Tax=Paenibacillus sp. D2_2 TaxID=3073092 RepID=UPI0028169654|nr:hypothetical protein [Paenibacillus sp. D2_2]WMT40189.1 hypothetical protein RE628_23385 [Paenibacillus sp. D2_2]